MYYLFRAPSTFIWPETEEYLILSASILSYTYNNLKIDIQFEYETLSKRNIRQILVT